MIAACFFPGFGGAQLGDTLENGISLSGAGIGFPLDFQRPLNGVLAWRNQGLTFALLKLAKYRCGIVGTIRCKGLHGIWDPLEKFLSYFAIVGEVVRTLERDDLESFDIDNNMAFPPCPALAHAMLPDFPFSFAVDFESRRVDSDDEPFAWAA